MDLLERKSEQAVTLSKRWFQFSLYIRVYHYTLPRFKNWFSLSVAGCELRLENKEKGVRRNSQPATHIDFHCTCMITHILSLRGWISMLVASCALLITWGSRDSTMSFALFGTGLYAEPLLTTLCSSLIAHYSLLTIHHKGLGWKPILAVTGDPLCVFCNSYVTFIIRTTKKYQTICHVITNKSCTSYTFSYSYCKRLQRESINIFCEFNLKICDSNIIVTCNCYKNVWLYLLQYVIFLKYANFFFLRSNKKNAEILSKIRFFFLILRSKKHFSNK